MTAAEIRKIAMRQSAIDSSCDETDFCAAENKIVLSEPHPKARRYLELPFFCQLVSYGGNLVASVSAACEEPVRRYIRAYSAARCFETPHLHVLNDALEELGHRLCFMAEYFLPDCGALQAQTCPYEIRLLTPEAFAGLYLPQWRNALSEKRKELDRLAAGAFDNGRLVGLAGCSADCDTMWQIGVDVLPSYRRRGVAAALTSRLALEILQKGIVPFYCAAWSNLPSVRNAMRSGFRPAWVELTAKPCPFAEEMNRW